MPNIKLIALDLDNTLLTNDKQITDNTRYWLNKAREQGITITFSTGRGIQTIKHLWEQLELDSPMILVNGAEIWKSPGELLERHVLPADGIRELVKFAESHNARFWGYSMESLTQSKDWSEEKYQENWLKYRIRYDHIPTIDRLRDEVRSWGLYEVTQSHVVNMEISPLGINKGYGVKRVCDYLGITLDEVMAVGDSHNDLTMLEAAGLGVAMENALPAVKAIADFHTSSNEEEGVAKAIQRFVFGEKLEVV